MNWTLIESAEQLDNIKQQTGNSIIFKHSTRCSISTIPTDVSLYFLDLIKHRELSNKIATDFQVHHESPQMLLIKDGECILDQSHGEISVEEAVSIIA
jgi:bacillithiol system protein YtxJ